MRDRKKESEYRELKAADLEQIALEFDESTILWAANRLIGETPNLEALTLFGLNYVWGQLRHWKKVKEKAA